MDLVYGLPSILKRSQCSRYGEMLLSGALATFLIQPRLNGLSLATLIINQERDPETYPHVCLMEVILRLTFPLPR